MTISDPWTYRELLDRIEAIFEHGTGGNWTNQDFGQLSDRIYAKTRKRLSITTLKRVWGRAGTHTRPSLTTLDILSEFVGYQGWRAFSRTLQKSGGTEKKKNWRAFTKKTFLIGTFLISGVFVLFLLLWDSGKMERRALNERTANIEFALDKVASGYPNTVVFEYDVGDLSYDSLYVQQSWDVDKRIPLKKGKGLVTTTYYYPGYFLAKLVIDSTVVREEELYIPTKGWQGILLEGPSGFTYLGADHIILDSTLRIRPELLEGMQAARGDEIFLANLAPEPEINGSNFTMETEFRMPHATKGSICKNIRLTVTGTKEVLSLQFSIPGCVGDLMFFMNKEMVSGRDNDLSAFGIETNDWTKCKVQVKNGQAIVSLNGKVVYTYGLRSDIGKIGGVQWMFQGIGEIRTLDLYDPEKRMGLIGQ